MVRAIRLGRLSRTAGSVLRRNILPGLSLAVATLVVLAGCSEPAPALRSPSAESQALAEGYAAFQASLQAQGLLRMDDAIAETPAPDRMIETFEALAFSGDRGLIRWSDPVRMVASFGPSVPLDTREAEIAQVRAFATRLGHITGGQSTG